ncbi:hypothetical protein BXZ70DRAFT_1011508 [Cristinia sonorae]|uniref:Uncharacterized protein n=1 Tax=Cristinia sonorae TaxID=1940300 RepID=A0A8K0UG72_9AGAR|nr:hypothetical protein BXZ70DRAFT_1011508 [Cristinia sonorae]
MRTGVVEGLSCGDEVGYVFVSRGEWVEKLAWRTITRPIKQLLEILQLEWQEQDAAKPAATTTNGATKPSFRPSSPPSTLSLSSQLGAASGSSSVPQIQQTQMQPPMSAKARGKMRAASTRLRL